MDQLQTVRIRHKDLRSMPLSTSNPSLVLTDKPSLWVST
jgi:hypothetical protein